MEFENMKEAVSFLLEITNSNMILVDGNVATAEDVQEMVREASMSIADLLGISELYLEEVN